MLASLFVHLVLGLLLLIPLRSDFQRVLTAGNPFVRGGRGGGGGGGEGRVAYISLPAPPASSPKAVAVEPPLSTPPPVAPVPVPDPATVVPPPAEAVAAPDLPVTSAAAASDSVSGAGGVGPGQGGGAGGGVGGGFGPGVGTGVGPGTGTGSGEGGMARPPQRRHQVIPPENPPRELRGVELVVTFWVTERGSVAKVEVAPPIRDRKFAEKFIESMMQYRFRPALGPDGRPVAALTTDIVTY